VPPTPGVDIALRRAMGTVGGGRDGLGHRAGPSRAAAAQERPRIGRGRCLVDCTVGSGLAPVAVRLRGG
jgi:hypothetical protein